MSYPVIGGAYKTRDSIQCLKGPRLSEIHFVIPQDAIITIIDISYESRYDLISYKIVWDNKIGSWYFKRGSWSHKLLETDRLLQNIEVLEEK